MIHPNELRIGNLAHHNHSKLKGDHPNYDSDGVRITGIASDGTISWAASSRGETVHNENSYDLLEPIPLTAEWLEKFGFTHHPNGLYVLNMCWVKLESSGVVPMYCDGTSFCRPCAVSLYYVHQLQNWFHISTGDELIEPSGNGRVK